MCLISPTGLEIYTAPWMVTMVRTNTAGNTIICMVGGESQSVLNTVGEVVQQIEDYKIMELRGRTATTPST